MILLVGLLLIALGLISGSALLASEMGWLTISHALTLWFMFPFGSALGLLIAALGAHRATVPALLKITGGLMLILSMASAVTLVLASAGLLPPGSPGQPA